jgi:hypothetical protein
MVHKCSASYLGVPVVAPTNTGSVYGEILHANDFSVNSLHVFPLVQGDRNFKLKCSEFHSVTC